MSQDKTKQSVSISLDKDIVDRIEDIPGVKRSTLINECMGEWLDENGY
jgi:uncharacterized protein (DUF4415 family)